MLLLFVDAVVLILVVLAILAVILNTLEKRKENKVKAAIKRQKEAEEMAKAVDSLDVESIKANEKKVDDKLDGLH